MIAAGEVARNRRLNAVARALHVGGLLCKPGQRCPRGRPKAHDANDVFRTGTAAAFLPTALDEWVGDMQVFASQHQRPDPLGAAELVCR